VRLHCFVAELVMMCVLLSHLEHPAAVDGVD